MIPNLQVLFDEVPGEPVPEYGGSPRWSGVAVNFVESIDGVTALPEASGESGGVISGGSQGDKFVMGLLRACADAVLIGAGTLRAAPRDTWYAESIFPAAREIYQRIGRLHPPLYVVSGSGNIPPLPPGGVLLQGKQTPQRILERLRADGHEQILCEGGPGLFAELASEGLVDELFLTISPRLWGRFPADGRKALTDRRDLKGQELRLRGVRRDESHLFLRYGKKSRT